MRYVTRADAHDERTLQRGQHVACNDKTAIAAGAINGGYLERRPLSRVDVVTGNEEIC